MGEPQGIEVITGELSGSIGVSANPKPKPSHFVAKNGMLTKCMYSILFDQKSDERERVDTRASANCE